MAALCGCLVAFLLSGNVWAWDGSSHNGFNGRGRDIRVATDFLNDYSLAYAVHYACGRNDLGAPVFEFIPPVDFSLDLSGVFSPQLVELITDMQDDPVLEQRVCDTAGPLAGIFETPELTNSLLNGLMWLSPTANGLEAYHSGVYDRLRGYDHAFERYVESARRRLNRNLIVRR